MSRNFYFRLCVTFHTLLLFYLRTLILRLYTRKNYATVEIHLEREQLLPKIPEQACEKLYESWKIA